MSDTWPALPYGEWAETCETLHMWMQVVGKVKVKLTPFLNELWNTGFHVNARGITTGLIPSDNRVFEVTFDFVDHRLYLACSDGQVRMMRLEPRSVASFYDEFLASLRSLGIDVTIDPKPTETPITIACDVNETHKSYDSEYVNRFWRIMVQTERVLQRHRSGFMGKSSPVLFYWGSFDLSHVRYSGKPVPPPAGAPRFFQLAEDEQNATCGFWPGNPNAAGVEYGKPAFYTYTYPMPDDYRGATVQPAAAHFDQQLGEFVLAYDDVRESGTPDDDLLNFFRSTYDAAANLGQWPRQVLERKPGSAPPQQETTATSPVGP